MKPLSKSLFRRDRLNLFILRKSFLTILSCLFSFISLAQPSWTGVYPTIVNGATTADIALQVNQTGTAYYVVYTTFPTGVTSAKIKADAISPSSSSVVRNGRISMTANALQMVYLTKLPDGQTYYIYVVAESSSGLQNDASFKSFTKVFPKRQTENSFRSKFGPNALVGYLTYVPEDYYKNPSTKYPVLLFLHGSGEKAWQPQDLSQLQYVKKNGPPFLISQGKDFPFIVISPQCPFNGWDDITNDNYKTSSFLPGQFVNEIFDVITSQYRIDPSRVYLTGLSMGGSSVWSYLSQPYNRLAAAIPIAGWADANSACTVAKQNIAIWTFQGELDGAAGVKNMVDNINTCKPAPTTPAKLTVFAGQKHEVWDQVYKNTGAGIAPDNIYDWLMRHSKQGTNAPPVVSAGADQTISLPTISAVFKGTASDGDGIAAYTWTKLSGPSATLQGTNTTNLSVYNLVTGTYVFQFSVTDSKGISSFDNVTLQVNPNNSTSFGSGLTAQYYNSSNFTGTSTTRIDTTVNFNWGSGTAVSGYPVNNFTARWTGKIEAKYSELYTLYTLSDDGIRLWINDVLLIDNWSDHAGTEDKAAINLAAGQKYDIQIDYRESWGQAEAKLSWSSATQSKQIIPKANLYPRSTSQRMDDEQENNFFSASLSAYPVPAKDILTLEFTSSLSGETQIKLMDQLSQEKLIASVATAKGSNTATIDLSQLATGIYVLVLTKPDRTETTKIIVNK